MHFLRTVAATMALGLPLTPSLTWGHDDAEWIQNNPKYKRMQQPELHCCGPEHCGVAPAGRFVEVDNGGILDTETKRVYTRKKGEPGIYPSIDAQWWFCWYYTSPYPNPENHGREPVCIFVPFSGS